jgi:hypothetical protein
MKKLIFSLLMLAGLVCGQTKYAVATQQASPFWVVPSATMTFDLWTNSILWLTAESPVLNAGETNANWICYAKTCTGNAYQTGTGYQPTSIVTNGIKALYFDGTDDYLLYPTSPRFSGTNSFTLTMWMDLEGYWPAGSGNSSLGGVQEAATTNRSWHMQLRGPSTTAPTDILGLITSTDGAGSSQNAALNVPKSALTNGWTHLALIRSGLNFRYVVDGVPYGEATFSVTYASSAPLSIGALASGSSPSSMLLADIKFHGVALATNVITDIFNDEKARYGK